MVIAFWLAFILAIVEFICYLKAEKKYFDYKCKYDSLKQKHQEIENYFCDELCCPQGCGDFTLSCIKSIIKEIKDGVPRI